MNWPLHDAPSAATPTWLVPACLFACETHQKCCAVYSLTHSLTSRQPNKQAGGCGVRAGDMFRQLRSTFMDVALRDAIRSGDAAFIMPGVDRADVEVYALTVRVVRACVCLPSVVRQQETTTRRTRNHARIHSATLASSSVNHRRMNAVPTVFPPFLLTRARVRAVARWFLLLFVRVHPPPPPRGSQASKFSHH